MDAAEVVAMEKFLILPADDNLVAMEEIDPNEDNFEAQLKRARREIPVVSNTKYMELSFIKPDTCVVERLFSQAKKVWIESRKSMTPAHMELLLVLKCNRDLWDSNLVYKCRSSPRLRPHNPIQAGAEEEIAQDAAPGMLVEQLDNPEMGDHEFVFMQQGEDADFWDDENIAAMLGDLDV